MTQIRKPYRDCLKVLQKLLCDAGTSSSCYVTGSVAGGYAIDGISDLDITLIFEPTGDFPKLVEDALITCNNQFSHITIDPIWIPLSEVVGNQPGPGIWFREGIWSAKLAGIHIWGPDCLANWSMPNIQDYTERTRLALLEFARRNSGNLSNSPPTVANFWGFVDKDEYLKLLVSFFTWHSTYRIAVEKGIMVGSKKQSINMMKEIDSRYGTYLSNMFYQCRDIWGYISPQEKKEIYLLQAYCHYAFDIMNDFNEKHQIDYN